MEVYAILGQIARILIMLGALNWGMIGVFGINVIERIFGPGSKGERVMYILIGVAGLYILIVGHGF
jgi:uncharacterized membrane protein YuzA (DUF378 family)